MTLPTSGPISIGMVAAELGVGMVAAELGVGLPLSLGDARVRALAGVPSGPISLGNLYGKSAYTPMTVNAFDGAGSADSAASAGTVVCTPAVGVTGGTGGYTYLWSFTDNPDGCALTLATAATCSVSHAYPRFGGGNATAVLQCAVTDNTGHTVVRGGISAMLSWDSSV